MSNEIDHGKQIGTDAFPMLRWLDEDPDMPASFGIVTGSGEEFGSPVGGAIGGIALVSNTSGAAFTLTKRNAPAIIAELQRLLDDAS